MSFTAVVLLSIISFYSYLQIERLNENITTEKINEVEIISNRVQSEINQLTNTMQITSTRHALTQLPAHTDLISEQLKGVPENVEIENRQTAKDILNYAPNIEYVFYSLPNGDIYFMEPYSSQISLSKTNFAFRDWYHGVVETKKTYISEAYVSDNVHHTVIAIAVPLYAANSTNKTMTGIWVGALDLVKLNDELSSMSLGDGEYITISDFNNNVVVDSRQTTHEVTLLPSSIDLRGKSQGNAETEVDTVNNTKMLVAFKPIQIGAHQWNVALIQPYDKAFLISTTLLNESILMASMVIIAFSISGVIIVRHIKKTETISKEIEKANKSLELYAGQLRQADVAKEEFSAMITHELKTPLVPILGYCKMLKTSMLGKLTSEATEAVEIIEKNTKRLEELIVDIMDVRKLDIDKMRFNFENLPLDEFFNTLNLDYKKVLGGKGIEFVTKLSCGDSIVNVDRIRLRQVFDNLISNSIKYVPREGGRIEIGGYNDKNDVILYVKDNGIGIPKDKQKDLFKKFYQIDTSERRESGGTGLGLAISKGIMEKMKGSIWVESDEKSGTIVFLQLGATKKKIS